MAFRYSPKIVTDGLVLCLDAANPKSIVSGSTVWNDLGRNSYTGTLTNGPIYNSSNGGNIVFDGNDDSCSLTTLNNYGSEMATKSVTIEFGFKSSYIAGLRQFGVINNGGNTLLAINFNRDENDNYVARKTSLSIRANGGLYLVGAMNTDIYTNSFFIITAIRIVNTNTILFYVNGVPVSVTNGGVGYNGNPISFSNFEFPFTIGALNSRGVVGSHLNCSIPFFKIYNRQLSSAEILQNYNTIKSRFGL